MSAYNTTDVEIYETLIRLIRKSVGDDEFTVIVGNQSGREPNGEFAVIYDIASQTRGMASADWDSNETEAVVTTSQLVRRKYMIQFWRGDAHDNAFVFCAFTQAQSCLDILYGTNIAVFVSDSVTRIDDEFGGSFVAGASIDVIVETSSAFVETLDVMDDVELIIEDE